MGRSAQHVTARERDVWSLLARHHSNPEIAAELCLSVRTVESHVASLIRKLQVTDRRSLARIAVPDQREHTWPSPASSFIGRDQELAALASALTSQRLLTVTGPGGVGKTRLALEAAVRAAGLRRDDGWFVDLVQVTDPAMVLTAIARAIGVSEQLGRNGLETAVIHTLTSRHAIVVLDNCEHVIDAVRSCVERLLTTCRSLTIVVTSRLRLRSAPEWVYDVPGLSEAVDGDGVALFMDRASAAGAPPIDDRAAVAELCRRVDGIALAIELAAARYPSLGLDGLSLGLGPGLPALRTGAGSDARHRSMTDALAWSFDLLAPPDRALLCTIACFASWFEASAAVVIASSDSEAAIADRLSTLADHHLLVAVPGNPTRYRALEVVRQFAHERSARLGLSEELHDRHLAWCRDNLAELAGAGKKDSAWRARLDRVATEARAALGWAQGGNHPVGGELAELLAEQLLERGYPAESQRRYEQAAALIAPGPDRARLLDLAAGAAACRMVGDDALRLLRSAAEEYVAAGDSAQAAHCLAWIGIYTAQAPGIIAHLPSRQDDQDILKSAIAYASGSPSAAAAVAVAAAGQLSEGSDIAVAAGRAAQLSREAGAPLLESAALDELCAARLAMADFTGALAALDERQHALETVPVTAASAFQLNDFLLMASEVNLAVGNLSAAGSYADRLADLPYYREQDHLAYARRIKVDAIAGDLEAVVARGERFVEAWEHAGRPVATNLASTAYAVAATHDLVGSSARRRRWVGITRILANDRPHHRLDGCVSGYAPTLDALVLLDRGRPALAAERLSADIDDPLWAHWDRALWRLWYAALWSEAAALTGRPDTHDRLRRAAALTEQNPIAHTIVARSAAWWAEDAAAVQRHAHTFAELGCGYQARRTAALGQQCGR
ncbi:MAG: LuxR C-terminal-related transcriptional regulator [Phycicoccus sp.]